MKILVTGSDGQLGRELREVFENNIPGQTLYAGKSILDVTDSKAIESFLISNEITHIVNCAAYTDVDRAEEEKLQCAALNVNAVKNLALAADSVGAKIIHLSTGYVFDGNHCRPYRESDKVNPISQYGTTKRTGETALMALAPESIIIRTSWMYSQTAKNNFVYHILSQAAQQKEIKVVCDQIGTPTSAADLSRAILSILSSRQWVPGIFHFTNEGACSRYDYAKAVLDYACINNVKLTPILTEDYPQVVQRPFYSVLDKSMIKATYSVTIPHWTDSLKECISHIDRSQFSK